MKGEQLTLIEPTARLKEDFLEMAREYTAFGTDHEKRRYGWAIEDFEGYLRLLAEEASDHGPKALQQQTYWLVRDERRIVATSRIRRNLAPEIEQDVGNVGYGTRPSERGKGYGNIVCEMTLQQAARLGMTSVTLTCMADNLPSARIIEHNGGVLVRQVTTPQGALKNIYTIDLSGYLRKAG